MREVTLQRFDGGMDVIKCYTEKEFDFINMPDAVLTCRHTKKPREYLKLFATFDIESTTIKAEKPFAFMYHWQMDIGGVVVYGRRWEEWANLLNRITDWLGCARNERHLVIYVHNLGFEFEFCRDFLNEYFGGFSVFASQKRKPIKVITNNGIEFRCTYKLSNMSLSKFVSNELGTIHPKADGDLDYKIIRTADTYLDDTEFGYCIADVVSLYEAVKCRLKNEHDNLETIPLTSTGYVRRDCRRATRNEDGYRERFLKQQMTSEVYTLLCEAGRGGNTHANRYMAGRIWHNVDGYDVASSYPYQMVAQKYPCTKFVYYGEISSYPEMLNLIENYACLFRVVFHDLQIRKDAPVPYIPIAKMLSSARSTIKGDNGRVLCGTLAMTITDIDFKIIKEQYTWRELAVSDFYFAEYGELPESLRGQIMRYFEMKTELKDKIKYAEGEEKANLEYLYAKSKNRLNGIFGMCYTNPIHEEIVINEVGEWDVVKPNIDEGLEKYYKSRNSFLVYAHGIWTTCWARYHLQKLLNATNDINYGNTMIYCDTDSSKAIINNPEPINKLNEEIRKHADEVGAYVDYNNERYYMGVYEHETDKEQYAHFKTLGAKKYVYDDSKGLHVTISGVGKVAGAKELGTIENFKQGFIFNEAGGNTLYYNPASIHQITIDGCTMTTASNVAITDSTYKIGITEEYAELLDYYMEV